MWVTATPQYLVPIMTSQAIPYGLAINHRIYGELNMKLYEVVILSTIIIFSLLTFYYHNKIQEIDQL